MRDSLGCRMVAFGLLGAIAFLAGCTDNQVAQRCGGHELVRQVMIEQQREFSYFALQNSKIAEYTLFVSFPANTGSGDPKTAASAPWVLMKHRPDDRHCIEAKGNRMEPLASLHDANPESRFGLPGSGYPRCSRGNSVTEMLDVRLWANRELGDSVVFSFTAENGSSYVFLLNKQAHWILLESDAQNPKITCYLARGESVASKTLVPK